MRFRGDKAVLFIRTFTCYNIVTTEKTKPDNKQKRGGTMKNFITVILTAVAIALAVLTVNAVSYNEAVLPTTSAPTAKYTKSVKSEIKSRGSYGRVKIEDADIDVALFYTKDLSKLQQLTDAEDSAAMFKWKDGNVIVADHSNQGFGNLREFTPDNSYAYITTAEGVETYKCVEKVSNGWNLGSTLAFADKTAIGTKYTGSLILYTCNNKDGTRVTITVWEKVEKTESGAAYTTYTVKTGDSAWSIAYKFLGDGSRYTEIVKLNGLTTSTVVTGQVLRIPLN